LKTLCNRRLHQQLLDARGDGSVDEGDGDAFAEEVDCHIRGGPLLRRNEFMGGKSGYIGKELRKEEKKTYLTQQLCSLGNLPELCGIAVAQAHSGAKGVGIP